MGAVQIGIELDPSIPARIEKIAGLLETAPDLVRQCLLDRISRLFAGGACLDTRAALRAGQHVVIVELLASADKELVAIAACAAQRSDVCHGCPSPKVV